MSRLGFPEPQHFEKEMLDRIEVNEWFRGVDTITIWWEEARVRDTE